MNKVILIGRFTRDPESRMSANNLEVARFSLACGSDIVRDGQRETEFINCVAFGRNANTINRFCVKGSQIAVQGRIRNNNYTAQDGTKRYNTDVIVDNFEFLNSNRGQNAEGGNSYNSNSNNSYEESPSSYANNNIEVTDVSSDPYENFGTEVEVNSDDLPF